MFEEILNSDSTNSLQEGNVVTGVVTRLDKDYAIIDVGGKMEGRVLLSEFDILCNGLNQPEGSVVSDKDTAIAVGDLVSVYVERIESYEGNQAYAKLSRQRAILYEKWGYLDESFQEKRMVEGIICHRVKGGCSVDIGGVAAFLPGSQIDVNHVKDIAPLVGITHKLLIMSMNKEYGNIVVSRRAVS